MQAYKFNTYIKENGIIFLPFVEPTLYNKQVEIIVLPVSEKKEQDSIKTLLNENENSGKQNEEVLVLPDWQKEILQQRLKSVEQGNTVSQEEAHKIFEQCLA